MVMKKYYPIPGYNPYEISKCGSIKGQRVSELKHWSNKNHKDNYPCVCMFGVKTFVHRLLALTFIPNPNNYPYINHKDGNKLNLSLDNLEWCTPKQNSNHAKSIGLGRNGVKINTAILDEIQVRTIKSCIDSGIKMKDLATYFKVKYPTIYAIKSGANWNHI